MKNYMSIAILMAFAFTINSAQAYRFKVINNAKRNVHVDISYQNGNHNISDIPAGSSIRVDNSSPIVKVIVDGNEQQVMVANIMSDANLGIGDQGDIKTTRFTE